VSFIALQGLRANQKPAEYVTGKPGSQDLKRDEQKVEFQHKTKLKGAGTLEKRA
jgi:hypothetical protein